VQSQRTGSAVSPSTIACLVLSIAVSVYLSVSVVPRFQPRVHDDPNQFGASLARFERRLSKLESDAGVLTHHQQSIGLLQGEAEQRLKKLEVLLTEVQTAHRGGKADQSDTAWTDPDYASYEANGRVVGHSDLYPRRGDPWLLPSRDGDWFLFSLPYVQGIPSLVASAVKKAFPVHPKASVWLLSAPSNGIELPGHCLPLNGSTGYVDVKLRRAIRLKSFSVEHIPRVSAFNITTAPKDMALYSLRGDQDGFEPRKLASFSYDIESTPVQTFPVLQGGESADDLVVSQLRLQVNSNHGSESYTCLYRLKIYGDPE